MEIKYWVAWLIVGLVLLAGEIFTGTFHLLFFGLAGLLTAALVYMGVEQIWLQIAFFGILSLISFFIVQKKFSKKTSNSFDNDLNQVVILSDNIPAKSEGTIQYQGSPWTAVNTENESMSKGDKAVIVKTEGIKIFLKKV